MTLCAALLGSLAVAPAVRAETSAPTAAEKAKAKRSLERGQKLYKAGKLEEAQAAFRESHDAVPDPNRERPSMRRRLHPCPNPLGEVLRAFSGGSPCQVRRYPKASVRPAQREIGDF